MFNKAIKTIISGGDFVPKTWNGLTSFSGSNIWTDGENIYYSNYLDQYILDKTTSTWNRQSWNLDFYGDYVYHKGNETFLFHPNGNYYYAYRLLKDDTDIWWSSTSARLSDRDYIWSDGDNIYYSRGTTHYVLGTYNGSITWLDKTWNGLTDFYGGDNIFTDGNNIYYTYQGDSYVLNKSTSTWTSKTWNGFNPSPSYVWLDNDGKVYYSYRNTHYILNKSTSTWTSKTWNGLTNFYGAYIWTDGDNIYYSNSTDQYVLQKSITTLSSPIIK